jgi:hypothetical protein
MRPAYDSTVARSTVSSSARDASLLDERGGETQGDDDAGCRT